jgi:hypothetical protein
MTDVKFSVNYFKTTADRTGNEFSHSYDETWEHTDLHCLRCGEKDLWRDEGPGDYYAGPQHLCASCGATFHLPDEVRDAHGEQNAQRLAEIRSSATEPRVIPQPER